MLSGTILVVEDRASLRRMLERALVEEGYLRSMPMDPITKRTDTWVEIYEELDPDFIPAETDLPAHGIARTASWDAICTTSG